MIMESTKNSAQNKTTEYLDEFESSNNLDLDTALLVIQHLFLIIENSKNSCEMVKKVIRTYFSHPHRNYSAPK